MSFLEAGERRKGHRVFCEFVGERAGPRKAKFENPPGLRISGRRFMSADQPDLFAAETPPPAREPAAAPRSANQPLAARMRPQKLSEVVGQEHLLKAGSLLPRLVAQNRFCSLVFFGPPGCGKSARSEEHTSELQSRFGI